MSRKRVYLTTHDRMRLGTMLETAQPATSQERAMLHDLELDLDQFQGVAPEEVPDNVVTMNSTVEVRDLDLDDLEVYSIVYPDRADVDRGRISVLAPLGRALLGRRAGDVVRVATPSGKRRVRIERIRFQPEAAGAYHL